MERQEHLLVILCEECAELSKEVLKALRFGLDGNEPGKNKTNGQKIIEEFNDLFAVMDMLCKEEILQSNELLTIKAIEDKQKKVEFYLKYSKSVGR